jgi:hypothetical protein
VPICLRVIFGVSAQVIILPEQALLATGINGRPPSFAGAMASCGFSPLLTMGPPLPSGPPPHQLS